MPQSARSAVIGNDNDFLGWIVDTPFAPAVYMCGSTRSTTPFWFNIQELIPAVPWCSPSCCLTSLPGRKPSYGRLAFYVTTLFIPLTPNVRDTPVLPANVNFTPHPLRIWVSRRLFKRGRRVAESLHLRQEWAVIMMDELQFVHGPIYSDTSAITDGLDADVAVATM